MKLSSAQHDVLSRLAQGESAKLFQEHTQYFYSYGECKQYLRKAPIRTVEGLIKRGLLKETDSGWLGKAYIITQAGREALAQSEERGRPLTRKESDLLKRLDEGASLKRDVTARRLWTTGCSIRPSWRTVESLKQQGFISGGEYAGYTITDAGREALRRSKTKPTPLTKKQRFILLYLQRNGIARFPWESSLHTYRTLELMEGRGFVKQVDLPDHLLNHTLTLGHIWGITEAGREKRISDRVAEGAEYLTWLAEHEEAEAEYLRRVQGIEERIQVLRAMPYAEYLETPEWKSRRRRAIERANYRCESCSKEDFYTLHVHHKTYERRGNEEPGDLVVLCGDCHARIHGPQDQRMGRP